MLSYRPRSSLNTEHVLVFVSNIYDYLHIGEHADTFPFIVLAEDDKYVWIVQDSHVCGVRQ